MDTNSVVVPAAEAAFNCLIPDHFQGGKFGKGRVNDLYYSSKHLMGISYVPNIVLSITGLTLADDRLLTRCGTS